MIQLQYRTHMADMEDHIPLLALSIHMALEIHIQMQSCLWFHLDNVGVNYGR